MSLPVSFELISILIPIIIFFTGRQTLTEFDWLKQMSPKKQALSVIGIFMIAIAGCNFILGFDTSEISSKTVSAKINDNSIKVVIRVDNAMNDKFSGALAMFFRERGYKATVGDYSGPAVGTSVIGDMSISALHNGIIGDQHFTMYAVKLKLKFYKGDDVNPCTDRIYEEKIALVAGDKEDKIFEEGFQEFLNRIKTEPTNSGCQ